MSMNTSTTDFSGCPDVPVPSYPPPSTHAATFKYSGIAVAPQNSPVPKFRVLRVLGMGRFATAMLAQFIESNRLFCLKVFEKDQLEKLEDVIFDELAVYRRVGSLMPCPARNFLMGLELSFQTKTNICFAMGLMAGDLSKLMIDRPSYCCEHALRWTSQVALGIRALTSAVGTTYCMAPEVLQNKLDPGSQEYGTPVDWWSLGCVVYQLVSKTHKALFHTRDDIFRYVLWCSDGDIPRRSRKHSKFKVFPRSIRDLLSGLLDINVYTRYGFDQVVCHDAFVCVSGETLFSDAYTQAEEREELPDSLPKFQYSDPSEVWCGLLPGDTQHIPNVDWVKPNYER